MTSQDASDQSNQYFSDPDVILMLEFQKGNKASFEALMRKYYGRVLNFVYRFVNNRDMAEDITQDVFVKIYKSASGYKPKAKFQTWVFTIAKNTAFNEYRHLNRQGYSLDESFSDGSESYQSVLIDEQAEKPDERLKKAETVKIIREALQALPEQQRAAVILRRYQNFSYEEIAQTMGTSVKAVKSLLNRAKENLKNMLSKHFED